MKLSRIILVAAGAATAVALSLAQDARADEPSFINDVASHGVPVAGVTLAIGHQICTDVSTYGTEGFDNEATEALKAGVSEHDIAVLFVAAVYDLCPSNTPALRAWGKSTNT